MEYKVLALGDVASETGLQLLEKKLRAFKKEHDVRFTVVNGENISGSGLTKAQAEALFAAGADVITLGNHTFGKPADRRLSGRGALYPPARQLYRSRAGARLSGGRLRRVQRGGIGAHRPLRPGLQRGKSLYHRR